MNRNDDQRNDSNGNDFWGGKADWSAAGESTTEHERFDAAAHWAAVDTDSSRPLARVRRSWSKLLSSGADATRSHGITRPDVPAEYDATPALGVSADMFDDLDDDDVAYGAAGTHVRDIAAVPIDDAGWDAEFMPTPAPQRVERTRGAIDPLLLRLGAVAVVGALLVPLMLQAGSDNSDRLAASSTASETSTPAITLLPGTTTSAVVDATSTQLDPNDLPPAVPVATAVATQRSIEADAVDSTTSTTSGSTTSTDASAALSADSVGVAAPSTSATTPALDAAATADEPAARVERICAIDYTVVSGDFWIRLADAAGVELAELLEANGASASTPLYPGAEICLPAGSKTPAPPTTSAPTTAAPTTTATPATTAAPTTTQPPATTVAPTTAPTGSRSVEQIIRDVWPDELEARALEIAYRESRHVPTAKNFCCYGLFQIYWSVHKSWLAELGITSDQQLYDPETNARAAYALYQRAGGWGPWSL